MNVLLGVTGSVASIYTLKLINSLLELGHDVKLVMTQSGQSMIDYSIKCKHAFNLYHDGSEQWSKLGDKILHIELRKWADVCVIAPLSLNTLAKISNGICDNLLTQVVRAWDFSKPIIVCPSGNTYMWENDPTAEQINNISSRGFVVIPPIVKTLACGDTGIGGLCNHSDIINEIESSWHPPINNFILPDSIYPGSFGFVRKYDVHTGIDLYCKYKEPVFAVEDSYFVSVNKFTGPDVGSPWWYETYYMMLKGKSGVVCYGEIFYPYINGHYYKRGQLIGYVAKVLPDDKLRLDIPNHSTSMLHIELYKHGTSSPVEWKLNSPKPANLLNPYFRLSNIK